MAKLLQCFGHHHPLPSSNRSTIKLLFILYIIFESLVSCNSLNSNLSSTVFRSRRGHPTGKRHSPFHSLSLHPSFHSIVIHSTFKFIIFPFMLPRLMPCIFVRIRFLAHIFASVSLSLARSLSPPHLFPSLPLSLNRNRCVLLNGTYLYLPAKINSLFYFFLHITKTIRYSYVVILNLFSSSL